MEMRTLEHVLADHAFLKSLEPYHVQLLVGCASNAVFQPGDYLMREGQEANRFYVIRSGKVAIEIATPERGEITVETIGEGDILGWSWLVPPYRWRFDGRAVELTRAIALDGKCLRAKCEEDSELGYELLKRITLVMVKRLEATRLQLLDLYGVRR